MQEKRAVWWAELSWPEVDKVLKNTDTVLLPMGSTEQHGRHLPLGVDGYIPIGIAEKVSAITGVPILPPIWYSTCSWHQGFTGTIHISSDTLIRQVVEICASVQRYGIKHIIGINGHTGGSDPALMVAADKVLEKTGARFWIACVVDVARDAIIDLCTSPVLGHADEIETAEMMAIRPDLVHLNCVKASNRVPKSEFLSLNYRPLKAQMHYRMNQNDWKRIAPEGYVGDPTAASLDKGEKMIYHIAGNIIKFIEELKSWDGTIG